MTSFSDISLQLPPNAPQAYGTFPARYVAEYLEHYVDAHSYRSETLRSRMRFNSRVDKVQKVGEHWHLHVSKMAAGREPAQPASVSTVICERLVVASGLTSLPSIPPVLAQAKEENQERAGTILHHRDFGSRAGEILATDSPYQTVTVVGGGKSAADMVYAAARAKKTVNWLVRKTGGEGPGIFLDPAVPRSSLYASAVEAGATRAATTLNPSAFRPPTWWAGMHHQCAVGRQLLQKRILGTDRRCKQHADYRERRGALPSFAQLETRASFFWNNGPIGLIQHDDFWDLISHHVNAFHADLQGCDSKSLILCDGQRITSDIVLCATGWDESYPFLSHQLVRDLGLPYHVDATDATGDEPSGQTYTDLTSSSGGSSSPNWKSSIADAAQQIKRLYPILDYQPSPLQEMRNERTAPAKLLRGIASLHDRSIVFLGRTHLANNFRGAEAQAIWATAYWDARLDIPTKVQDLQLDIAFHTAFSRLRYPTRGADGLNLHGDLIWYTDRLAHEAGLQSHRKAWWSDWNSPCLATDFRDCKDEYNANAQARTN